MRSSVRHFLSGVVGICGIGFVVVGISYREYPVAILGSALAVSAVYRLYRAYSPARSRAVEISREVGKLTIASAAIIGTSLVIIGIANHENAIVILGGLGLLGALLHVYRATRTWRPPS
jgi:hypothetical protein